MCYAYGSIEQATGICPMCKVFKPSGARCPHVKDVCHNRTLHPRHDVVYLKNAEVQTFNGCGFCKWALKNPPTKLIGYQNPGWPGCCRPPNPNEQRIVPAADWLAVSVVHNMAIPTEIKSLLDSLSSRSSPVPSSGGRGSCGSPSMPPLDRRNSANSSPSNKPNTLGKSPPMTIPAKGRPGGSPQHITAPLTGTISKGPGTNVIPSSSPNSSVMEQFHNHRRQTMPESSEKRTEPQPSQPSPGRRSADLDGSLARRSSGRRPTVTAATPFMSVSKVTVDAQPQPQLHRRASISSASSQSPKSTSPGPRSPDQQAGSVASRTHAKKPSLEISMAAVKLTSSPSSSGSSDGSSHGSMTDGTVTSDGGFTDYLSDESEAELQRQAEAKAALVAQNQAEELEFRAARQQLTHVDLRPPKSWNPSNNTNSGQRLQSM